MAGTLSWRLSWGNVVSKNTKRLQTGVWVEMLRHGCDKALIRDEGSVLSVAHAVDRAIFDWTHCVEEACAGLVKEHALLINVSFQEHAEGGRAMLFAVQRM